ncbi:methyl-accepting chemotaxis protein [Thalassospira sp. MA62]|nr:methyl-accepting chemotaxis protein [Thalassospira sp. MA62]
MFRRAVSNEATEKLEWLDILANHSGVGLWDAILHNGDAMHEKSKWTWTPEFRRLCGYSSEEEFPNVVQSWSDKLHPDDAPPVFEAFGNSLETGKPYDVIYRLKVKDGSYRWFRATGGTLKDKDGVPRRACGSLVDIHETKMAEAERHALLERLANQFESSVGSLVDAVTGSAEQLDGAAQSMSNTVGRTSELCQTVSAASAHTTENVQTVASAAEELSSSISEIGSRVDRASNIISEAVEQAEQTNAKIEGLAVAAQKIGDVVNLINDIAGQTNLLALNATIEAARAGDAGKGFAVVASEVKTLATQTSRATDEIANQIKTIQTETESSVQAIQAISQTINNMDEISAAIAAAVQQQGGATQEISGSAQQAADSTGQVQFDMGSVSEAVKETGSVASTVQNETSALLQTGTKLREQVGEFLKSIRA